MIVKLVRCKEGEALYDLTIGREYEVVGDVQKDGVVTVIDDVGDHNELFFEEYEVIEE